MELTLLEALSFTICLFAEADEWDHMREMVFQPPTNGDVNLWEIARLLRVEGCLLVSIFSLSIRSV